MSNSAFGHGACTGYYIIGYGSVNFVGSEQKPLRIMQYKQSNSIPRIQMKRQIIVMWEKARFRPIFYIKYSIYILTNKYVTATAANLGIKKILNFCIC